ncbi:MAG TPA: hypothetical protein VGC95_02380, partial [Chitinophagaceae bacterium]
MKNRLPSCARSLIAGIVMLTVCAHAAGQLPKLSWATHYGGSGVDVAFAIRPTRDGGTIVAGYTDSKDGQPGLHSGREYWDLWLVKLDKCGQVTWQQSMGGTGYESAR